MANKIVYRCSQGMMCMAGGIRYHFGGGDLVLEDHPVKPKNNPNFEEISEYVERTSQPRRRGVVIEEATAAPGERRRVGRLPGSRKTKGPVQAPDNVAPEAQEEDS